MKTISFQDLENDAGLYDQISSVLDKGGLVCLPCGSQYRVVADLSEKSAVMKLLQSKRRTSKAPSLVFVSGGKMLEDVAADIPPEARKLAKELWPGPLTILFEANEELPSKVVKQLVKANGKIGVRVPVDPVARRVVETLGRPLLVSSANRAKKQGASSPAQVRKNFAARVDIFIDAGDLPMGEKSTVVNVLDDGVEVTRAGAIPDEEITRIVSEAT